jgi:hypothetical protein
LGVEVKNAEDGAKNEGRSQDTHVEKIGDNAQRKTTVACFYRLKWRNIIS